MWDLLGVAMTDIVERIENRIHDAPMPTEHLLDAAAGEIRRLRQGIQDYLNGDYGRDYFNTKHDTCPHGLFSWNACENCIDAHFTKLLASDQ